MRNKGRQDILDHSHLTKSSLFFFLLGDPWIFTIALSLTILYVFTEDKSRLSHFCEIYHG